MSTQPSLEEVLEQAAYARAARDRMRNSESLALLREILEKDRAAISEIKATAPKYEPPEELLDLHRRIEACLASNY